MPNDDKTPAPEQQPPPPAPPTPLRTVASVIPLLGRLPGPVQDGIALVLIALVIVPAQDEFVSTMWTRPPSVGTG